MLSPFVPWSADDCIRTFECEGKKTHQGVAGEKSALHQGIAWSNSTVALGLRSLAVETRVRSRCTGKERDAESGLDNFDFRYYASTMGRFMKPDDPFNWNQSDPQSLNLYGYVSNNPLSRIDPDGHDCVYVDNDSGHITGWNSGDCDNSTEEKANSGYYVNGTVDWSSMSFDQASGSVNFNYTDENGNAGVWSILGVSPISLSDQISNSWQDFQNRWEQRIEAHRAPPQKPSNLDPLQYINNIMLGLVPYTSRGSTGRTAPRDLKEQLAMEQVKANPGAGKKLPLQMNDPRWPASDGWVKMSQNVNGVEVHYVENTTTGQVNDFKFK
jgi:RHS repeat-associated protein